MLLRSLLPLLFLGIIPFGFAQRTIHVENGKIYSACDEEIVMRGVNEMFIWSQDRKGETTLPEIAKTGSNTVRLVWTSEGSPAELDALIQNCLDLNMIPVPELHDATGDFAQLQKLLDYWKKPEVLAIIQKYKQWIIVNIGNEVGAGSESYEVWANYYKDAIDQLRGAGIDAPFMIDCGSYGSNEQYFLQKGNELLDYDPLHNIIFSVHTYWIDPQTDQGRKDRLDDLITEAKTKKLPFIIGEGPQQAASPWSTYCGVEFPYAYLIQRCQEENIGWLSWSWGLVDNNDCGAPNSVFDLTTDGVYGNWATTFAEEIMETSTYSVKNTSVIPNSMTNGNCGSESCLPIEISAAETNICLAGDIQLSISSDPTKTITWFLDDVAIPMSDSPTLTVNESGYYRAESDSEGVCLVFDDIYIEGTITTSLGEDLTFCETESITLEAQKEHATYKTTWSKDGVTLSQYDDQNPITITETGIYSVKVYSDYCEANDEINITTKIPELKDTVVCQYDAVVSIIGDGNYTWYSDQALTQKVGTGNEISVQQVASKTYYVRDESGFIGHIGKEELGESVWDTWDEASKDYRLGFEVSQELIVKSFDVYAASAGNMKVVFFDENQNELETMNFTVTADKNTLTINKTFAPGVYYVSAKGSSVNVKLNHDEGAYTTDYSLYTLENAQGEIMAIDRTYPDWMAGKPWYLYFYNWTVEVPNGSSCIATPIFVDVKTDGCTLALDETNELRIKVYPNPTKDVVYLEVTSKWELHNDAGKFISAGNSKIVDMSQLEAGIYLLKIGKQTYKINKL